MRRILIAGGIALVLVAILMVAVGLPLYRRALDDVDRYLAGPRAGGAGVVVSAPLILQTGRPGTVEGLADDLDRAYFTRTETLTGPDQYRVTEDGMDIWAAPADSVDGPLSEVRTTVTFSNGRVSGVTGGPHRLRPTVLSTLGDLEATRSRISLDQVSAHVAPALIAIEDNRFYSHWGVDLRGTARAVKSTVFKDDLQGGSTLTQQLAKNLFLEPDRTMKRKVREAFFALAIERRMSKDEILEMYLNEVYFGHVGGRPVYGIDQAARGFYGIPPSDLDVGQAATLASIISSPNPYSPVRHPEAARERRNIALARMIALGMIDEATAAEYRDRNIEVNPSLPLAGRRVPWVVDSAVERVKTELGGDLRDIVVHTTIEPDIQRAALQAVARGYAEIVEASSARERAQLALVAVHPSNGRVVALVGGRDWEESPFDRATDGMRQVGSLVKPLTMLAAMENDVTVTPATVLVDAPLERSVRGGDDWTPHNYDGRYWGPMPMRRAIVNSRNIPAVLLSERVGVSRLHDTLQRAGLSGATPYPSVALGAFEATPMQMAGAYTAFPNSGVVQLPIVLRQVDTPDRPAAITWESEAIPLAGEVAAVLSTDVLQDVVNHGTGARARRMGVEGPVGGKTGTTDEYRDAWFVGFTPDLVTAVWVGTDEGEGLGLPGSRGALPTWAHFMNAVGPSSGSFPSSSYITTVSLCTESHQLARPECPETYSEKVPRSAPIETCEAHDPTRMWFAGKYGVWEDGMLTSTNDSPFYPAGSREGNGVVVRGSAGEDPAVDKTQTPPDTEMTRPSATEGEQARIPDSAANGRPVRIPAPQDTGLGEDPAAEEQDLSDDRTMSRSEPASPEPFTAPGDDPALPDPSKDSEVIIHRRAADD